MRHCDVDDGKEDDGGRIGFNDDEESAPSNSFSSVGRDLSCCCFCTVVNEEQVEEEPIWCCCWDCCCGWLLLLLEGRL